MNFHLLDCKEMVFFGMLKIKNLRCPCFKCTVRLFALHRNTVTQKLILLLVNLHQRCRSSIRTESFNRCGAFVLRQPVVIFKECLPQIAFQYNFMVGSSAKRAVFAELFAVICIDNFPAQLLLQYIACTVLNQYVFGVFVVHSITPYL